jgi:hypothetical protein
MPWFGQYLLGAALSGFALSGGEEELAQAHWKMINQRLQATKPNRWIDLNGAAWIIAEKLDLLPGPAQELLQFKAIPPAVPWVGPWLCDPDQKLGPPMEITRATVMEADVDFGPPIIMSLPKGKFAFLETHIELNHLEAWLEKYQTGVAQAVPPVPTSKDMAPKNKGGSPRKFDKEAFMQQAAGLLAQPEGIRPKTRQQLTAAMAEWWLETWGEEAKPSTLRAFVAEIYSPKD